MASVSGAGVIIAALAGSLTVPEQRAVPGRGLQDTWSGAPEIPG